MAYKRQYFLNGQILNDEPLNKMDAALAVAVSVDAQTFTDAQKKQARDNIGAATVDEVIAALQTWEGGSY